MRFLYLAAVVSLCGCAVGVPSPVPAAPEEVVAERPDAELQGALETRVAGFAGDVGIYAHHLRTGATAAIRADEKFPTASMIKVPLLATLYQQVQDGELPFDTMLVFRDSLRYADYDLTGRFRDSTAVPLSELAFLAISFSDNTAALWIQSLIGGGAAANDWLAAQGFRDTRVNSRTPGRQDDWKVYGWGQTTPREMSRLMTMIRRGEVASPAASDRMYRTLSSIYYNSEGLSRIPPWVQVASKQGAVDRSRSETLLVNAPTGDYVLTIITRNQQDTTYAAHNEGYRLIRDVSEIVWRHWVPDSPWEPPAGMERFRGPGDES